MKIDRDLLTDFVARYPAQPATAFWRGIEIDVLGKADIPDGLGLDLGCGDGILTDILFKRIGRKPRLVGIDPDPLETDAARKYRFYERIHTSGGDSIPEPDATFDYVISNSVLEHIPSLEPVIREVGRVLKPGGRFFYTVPCPGFHDNLAGSIDRWIRPPQDIAAARQTARAFQLSNARRLEEPVDGDGMRVESCHRLSR